jgi:amino acid adenylation domain-containing protein
MIYQLWHLLAESARRSPERTAVYLGSDRLSYAELDLWSSRLAALLAAEGVARGDRVGIFLNKSVSSVVAIFGILKAGGVYVPIDPLSPFSRAAYIVGNCGIRHVVASRERLAGLAAALSAQGTVRLLSAVVPGEPPPDDPSLAGTRLLGWREVEEAPAGTPSPGGVETDLSYILYTSGSTGVPKGVMITHRAALTFIDWTHECFEMGERDVVSSHAPFHFDLSIFDLFTTLKAGGTIALVPERLSTFPVALAGFIRQERLSVCYMVPSALTLMLTRGGFAKQEYPDLRLVLFAGEVFPIKYLRELRRCTRARLANLYGPTETNVCTWYEVREGDERREAPVPIGVPIPNYDVFAVNGRGERAAAGEEGELWARGPGLMSGYWGDEEKTRRSLVPNPFSPHLPNDRVFKTNDLVVQGEDGNFVYLGRRDNMV